MKLSNKRTTRRSILKLLGGSSLTLLCTSLLSNSMSGTISSAFAATVSRKLDTKSVTVLLEAKVKPETKKEFLKFLDENLPNVRGFKGARNVTILHNETTMTLAIYEEWQSKDHHQNYIKFITENGVMAKLASFLDTPPSVKYFNKLKI